MVRLCESVTIPLCWGIVQHDHAGQVLRVTKGLAGLYLSQSSILILLLLLNFSYVVNPKTPASPLLFTVEVLGHGKLIHVTALISACVLMTEVNPAALVCSAPPPTNLTHSTCQPATNQVRQCGTLEL